MKGLTPSLLPSALRTYGSSLTTNVLLALLGASTGIISGRFLGPDGRGELAAIQTIPTLLAAICVIGMPEAIVYFTARRRSAPGVIVGTAVLVAFVGSIVAVIVALPLLQLALRTQTPSTRAWASGYLLICPLYALVWLPFHSLRGMDRLVWWNLFRLMPSLIWLLILLTLSMADSVNPERLALANLLGTAIMGVPIWLVVRSTIVDRIRPSAGLVSPLLRFGAPAVGTTLPQLLNLRLDQMVLVAFIEPRMLGLYVVAVGWSSAATPVLFAMGQVVFPQIARLDPELGHARLIGLAKVGGLVAFLNCLVAAGVTPVLFPILLGPQFAPAVPAAMILLLGASMTGLSFLLEAGLRGLNRQRLVITAEVVGLVVIGVTLLPLVKLLGIEGAACSSLLGYFTTLLTLLSGIWGRKRKAFVNSDGVL